MINFTHSFLAVCLSDLKKAKINSGFNGEYVIIKRMHYKGIVFLAFHPFCLADKQMKAEYVIAPDKRVPQNEKAVLLW